MLRVTIMQNYGRAGGVLNSYVFFSYNARKNRRLYKL